MRCVLRHARRVCLCLAAWAGHARHSFAGVARVVYGVAVTGNFPYGLVRPPSPRIEVSLGHNQGGRHDEQVPYTYAEIFEESEASSPTSRPFHPCEVSCKPRLRRFRRDRGSVGTVPGVLRHRPDTPGSLPQDGPTLTSHHSVKSAVTQ